MRDTLKSLKAFYPYIYSSNANVNRCTNIFITASILTLIFISFAECRTYFLWSILTPAAHSGVALCQHLFQSWCPSVHSYLSTRIHWSLLPFTTFISAPRIGDCSVLSPLKYSMSEWNVYYCYFFFFLLLLFLLLWYTHPLWACFEMQWGMFDGRAWEGILVEVWVMRGILSHHC